MKDFKFTYILKTIRKIIDVVYVLHGIREHTCRETSLDKSLRVKLKSFELKYDTSFLRYN